MDSMSDTSLRFTVVVIFLLWLYSMLMWNVEINQKVKLESKTKNLEIELNESRRYSDSLSSELLPKEIELGRYQVALEILKERNAKAASQFNDILSKETE